MSVTHYLESYYNRVDCISISQLLNIEILQIVLPDLLVFEDSPRIRDF